MDGQRLDGFARRFALSRRTALKTLAAGAVGAVLRSAGPDSALAKPRPDVCQTFCDAAGLTKRDTRQCYQDCSQSGTGGLYADCEGDPANLCTTPAGLVCYDTQSDPQHCGGCDQACPDPGYLCENGTCVPPSCGGDPLRVCQGAGGTFCCPEGQACDGGTCTPCQSGTAAWCVRPEVCTGPGTSMDGSFCESPSLPYCYVKADEYWRASYVCLGNDDFPGRATTCTPGIDCPACASGTGVNDPGFVPCPTPMACATASDCLPPSA